jgi:hypothetical protein
LLVSYDIKGAFLNAEFGPNDHTTYIKIPKEIVEIWITQDPSAAKFVDPERGDLILELDKFIYGLKQAPYKFQMHLLALLKRLGYVQQANDECLFAKHAYGCFSVISTHVDDILQTSNSRRLVDELHEGLVKEYKHITFNLEADAYLGMSIKRSKDLSRITLSQGGLIEKILDKHIDRNDHRTTRSPASDKIFETMDGSSNSKAVDKTNYLSLVMSLMYLARLTRPDILLPVTFLATRSTAPNANDLHEAHRICYYLAGTKNVGITIHCTSMQVYCLCDASYAVHGDGKSHTGFIVGLGSDDNWSYLHGRSGKQKLVALSSTDAEVIALTECLKQAIWLRNIIKELQITPLQKIIIMQDNKSAIIMVQEVSKFKHSKHILTKVMYVKNMVVTQVLTVRYLSTSDMTADVLTKPVHGALFIKHRDMMMKLT